MTIVWEPLTLALMLAAFGVLLMGARWPIGSALLVSAWLGAAVNGDLLPLRHLVEGAFSYLDPILVIATAMIFMRALADAGAVASIGQALQRRCGARPSILLPLVMFLVMLPGMITGSSTASVLTTGGMACAVLTSLGLAADRAAAFVAMGAVLGMIAPPITIPAMLIGAGLDLPYVGLAAPLALGAFPVALIIGYLLGRPLLDRSAIAETPLRDARAGIEAPMAMPRTPRATLSRAAIPLLTLLVLMVGPSVWTFHFRDPGLPLVFVIATGLGWLALPPFPRVASATRAVREVLPVLGILTGVGAFIQVMTLTGARGWLVSVILTAPAWGIVLAAAVSLPLFGAVSAFGSASVLGVPFLLALLGRDEIVTTAGLSMLAALGDLMLPAALAVTLATQAAGLDDRRPVLRQCVIPGVLVAVAATAIIQWAPQIGQIVR
ncbi:MAG: TRAP transporter large permease subunit [Vicinamibacterales bacterium]